MKYRQKNRLTEYDYSSTGYYFVTIRTESGECFGEVEDKKMRLNRFGEIVEKQWKWLSDQYWYVFLDEFVVMPDHFHGILIIDAETDRLEQIIDSPVVGGRVRLLQDDGYPQQEERIKPLSELIGAFKMTASKQIHEAGFSDFQWQQSFYDRIIRNEEECNRIRAYIQQNPINWENERNGTENIFFEEE